MSFPSSREEITSEWLSGVLGAQPGDIESISVEFVGDAMGNTSDVYFVRLAVRDGVPLPTRLVAKMIPRHEGSVEVSRVLRLFQREIDVYRNVAAVTPIRTPRLVWSDYDPETSLGLMLMEDCSACERFDQTAAVPASIEDLQRIVESAAKLHARWWNVSQFPKGVLVAGDPVRAAFTAMVAGGWQALLNGGPGSQTIPASGRKVAQCFADNYADLVANRWPTDHLTVMHLDFRLDNMFFDRASNEPVIFDWQGACTGRGPYDLAYLLSTGFAPGFRRQHEAALLRRYHDTLVSEGVRGYSLEAARQDYRFGMAHSLWVVPFTAILDLSSARGQALTNKVIGGIFSGIADHDAGALFEGGG